MSGRHFLRKRILFIFVFIFSISIWLTAAASLAWSDPAWQWKNPLPQANALHGICYGNDRFVAVGYSGAILSSPGGTISALQGARVAISGS